MLDAIGRFCNGHDRSCAVWILNGLSWPLDISGGRSGWYQPVVASAVLIVRTSGHRRLELDLNSVLEHQPIAGAFLDEGSFVVAQSQPTFCRVTAFLVPAAEQRMGAGLGKGRIGCAFQGDGERTGINLLHSQQVR